MTLKEIIELAYYRSSEELDDRETSIDTIVINAINQGIGIISTTIEKKTKSATLVYAEKINLPADFHSLVEIKHTTYGILSKNDYELIGSLLIPKVSEITSGSFTLTYIFAPARIITETTNIDLKDMHCISLAAYAAYQYLLSQKQYNSATALLNEFMMIVGKEEKPSEA